MTHRGPFQLLLFCDSVKATLASSCSPRPECTALLIAQLSRGSAPRRAEPQPAGSPPRWASCGFTLVRVTLPARFQLWTHTGTHRARPQTEVGTGRLKRHKAAISISGRTISIIRHSTPAACLLSGLGSHEPREEEQVTPVAFCVNLGPVVIDFIQTVLPLTSTGVLPE